jgi:hypothetical protein
MLVLRLEHGEWQGRAGGQLGRILEELRQPGKPTLIDGSAERTQSVIADLKLLADLPDDELRNEIIWYSGFLSSFSVGEVKAFRDDEQSYQDARLQEREWLLKLARRGCGICCVITRPSKDNLLPDRVAYALERVRALIAFLEIGDPALQNIEFVISPFLQKNFYIGRLCFSGGFRIGLESGDPLTLAKPPRGNYIEYAAAFVRCLSGFATTR